MNLLFRIIIAIGLLILAFINIQSPILGDLILNKHIIAYLDRNFHTTCFILLKNESFCSLVKNIISGLILCSGFCILLIGSKILFILASFSMILWTLFYANPVLDKSSINFDWFLQASLVVVSFLLIASEINKNK